MARDLRPTAAAAEDWLTGVAEPLRIGDLVGERYRIEARLGQGGMGLVFAATHTLTERPVAIKIIDAGGQRTEELHERFLSEARTAAAARHAHVVDVLDMGFHRGAPYLVMERLEGEPLDAALARLGQLPPSLALAWLLPIMDALVALHEKGIAHRDVKPSNVFLSLSAAARVTPKLLDFGLARVVARSRFTRAGRLFGTPHYMSPERARGLDRGPADDVWALAMMTFECLCGRLPFEGESLAAVAAQLAAGALLPARAVSPSLALPLAEVLDRSLCHDPAQRYPDVASFAAALVRAAAASGHSVPTLQALSALGARIAQGPALSVSPAPAQAVAVARPAPSSATPARFPKLAATVVVAMLAASALVGLAASGGARGPAVAPLPPLVVRGPLEAPAHPAPSVQPVTHSPALVLPPEPGAEPAPRVRKTRARAIVPKRAPVEPGVRYETEWR